VFLVFFDSNIVVDQDNSGDDTSGNTWTDLSPAVALNTETSIRHSCPSTLLGRDEGEDEGTSQTAMKLSRITIAATTSADDKDEVPQWMVDALKVGPVHPVTWNSLMSWKDNSAYVVEERPIPSISQQLQTDFPSEHVAHEAYITRPRRLFDGFFSLLDETSTWSLQRDDISRMRVISQLDRKFIVCVVDAASESNGSGQTSNFSKRILVLVDQHAASERVRVEGYLKTLCHHFLNPGHDGSQSTFRVKLEPPRPVRLGRREASTLRSSAQILKRWGFDLSWPETEDLDENPDQEVHKQVLVHSVPQVVGEKVRHIIVSVSEQYSFFYD
jgi:DNA mismatch repair protein MLH3